MTNHKCSERIREKLEITGISITRKELGRTFGKNTWEINYKVAVSV